MMYDFTYRSASAPTLGVFAPLKIEGAPDHGTIADAQVWAAHYDVRIDLLDGAGRVRRVVDPDGQVRDIKTVWFDAISPSGVEMATARALREAVERMERVAEKMRAAGITREDATKLRAKWLERYPEMRTYFGVAQYPISPAYKRQMAQAELDQAEARKRAWALGLDWQAEVDGAAETGESVAARVGRLWEIENTPSDDAIGFGLIYHETPPSQRERVAAAIVARTRRPSLTWSKWLEFSTPRRMQLVPANRAMSGKTAFLDDHIGLHRLQTDMCAFRMGRPHPRPTSLSYSTIAAFRGETCPSQFEEKLTPPARARHLSGVSVDLLIALGHKDHGKQQCAYSARCDFASFGGA